MKVKMLRMTLLMTPWRATQALYSEWPGRTPTRLGARQVVRVSLSTKSHSTWIACGSRVTTTFARGNLCLATARKEERAAVPKRKSHRSPTLEASSQMMTSLSLTFRERSSRTNGSNRLSGTAIWDYLTRISTLMVAQLRAYRVIVSYVAHWKTVQTISCRRREGWIKICPLQWTDWIKTQKRATFDWAMEMIRMTLSLSSVKLSQWLWRASWLQQSKLRCQIVSMRRLMELKTRARCVRQARTFAHNVRLNCSQIWTSRFTSLQSSQTKTPKRKAEARVEIRKLKEMVLLN